MIDIKPYIAYADRIEDAKSGYTDTVDKPKLAVEFGEEAQAQCREIESQRDIDLQKLIGQLVALDPRPAYQKNCRAFGLGDTQSLSVF